MFLSPEIECIFFISAFLYFTYLFSFFKLIQFNQASVQKKTTYPFVSVLICAKNEGENLKKYLPFILNQKEIDFEVIVINDQSEDETLKVLSNYQQHHTILKVFNTQGKSSKKKALTLAKLKAKGDIYLLTDADCKVNSSFWLKNMIAHIGKEHEVILGYAPYFYEHSFLNKLQRFETLTTAMQYFTAALFQEPYMGVGRNLAYSKYIDNCVILNKKQQQLLSGDDDLWVQQAKKITQFIIEINKDSFAYSKAEASWKAWWQQKKRHITTAKVYDVLDQIILSGIFLTKVSFWFSFFWLIFTFSELYIWILFILLISCHMLVYKQTSNKFSEKKIWQLAPFLDFCLICFQLLLFISNLLFPVKKWK